MRVKTHTLGFVVLIAAITTAASYAGETGHFVPGVPSLRDLAVPASGFYGVIYNYGYSSLQEYK